MMVGVGAYKGVIMVSFENVGLKVSVTWYQHNTIMEETHIGMRPLAIGKWDMGMVVQMGLGLSIRCESIQYVGM